MGDKNKDKTVSFRIRDDKFRQLKGIAEDQDLSLSSVFRDYVDMILAHDGQVEIVPKHIAEQATVSDVGEFPVKVEVPKSYVREHERLELEAEHLREQLDEYKRYVTRLRDQLEEHEDEAGELVRLEDVDVENGTSLKL